MSAVQMLSRKLIDWGNEHPDQDKVYFVCPDSDRIKEDIDKTFGRFFTVEYVKLPANRYLGIWFTKKVPEYHEFEDVNN